MESLTRQDLLALTPDRYLAEGYLDDDGALRPELRSEYATAAAIQLASAQVAPQELSMTFEGLRQLLPLHAEPDAGDRLDAAFDETLGVVARVIQQPNNEGLVRWFNPCIKAVNSDEELEAFLEHVQIVARQYSLIASAMPDPGDGPPPSSSSVH